MPTLNFKGKTAVETYHYTIPHHTLEFDKKLSVVTQPQFKEWIGKTVGKEGENATCHDKWCCTMSPRLMLQ